MKLKLINYTLSKDELKRYADIIGIDENILFNMDLKYCRAWDAFATVNCHTYPLVINKTEVVQLIKDCKDIIGLIENDKFENLSMDKCIEDCIILDDELWHINRQYINMNILVGFLIILFGKQKALYSIVKILDEMNYDKEKRQLLHL